MSLRLGKKLNSPLKKTKPKVNLNTCASIKPHKEINTENNQLCNQLKSFFNNEFDDSTFEFEYEDSSCSTLDIRDNNVSIYIRIQVISNPNLKRTIEIGSIRFTNERVGHGSALLKYISGIAESFNIKEIKILGTNDKSKSFAKKNGFELLKGDDYIARL